MLSKVQKQFLNVKYNIRYSVDILDYSEGILTVKGWLFSRKHGTDDVQIVIQGENRSYAVPVQYGSDRVDVYRTYQCNTARKSGYFVQIFIENLNSFQVYLTFNSNEKKCRLPLGTFACDSRTEEQGKPLVRLVDVSDGGINIVKMLREQKEYTFEFPEEFYSETIDVIVPVYNGYEYLETLLATIEKTKMNYHLILINDKSPDQRVGELLKQYTAKRDNVTLINNEENLGFLQSVNKGFAISTHHIALVNTDVELPEGWLERLMLPILKDERTASSTPFTNCGTICSFPEFLNDNELYLGESVQTIDAAFRGIAPRYETVPTGVGFCMGMNQKTLQEIGGFDAESFGKGYGEENDWCRRAIQAGYKNVHAENLFVYHKHGGSFLSEDKKRFLEEHGKILSRKHPDYNKAVARYCAMDPNKDIREFVKLKLILSREHAHTIWAFDHELGGGATKYLEGKIKEALKCGNHFAVVRFDCTKESYKISYYTPQDEIRCYVKNQKDLFGVMTWLRVDEIWINELVTYHNLYGLLRMIRRYGKEKDVAIRMLFHDFFAICPTINLLNWKERYCYLPKCEECDRCLEKSKNIQSLEYGSMEKWRAEWLEFFESCKEIVVFSNDSRNLVEKAFGKLENISVIPHTIEDIPVVDKKYKTTATLNIGLLGVLTRHKGEDLVQKLVTLIEKKNLDIRITLIGSSSGKIRSRIFSETGMYTRDSIPRLILENDIDIFLIPSIWPETFSYTTEEIMHMQMPVMCFDIGAPAERVKKYEKGIILPEISAGSVLDVAEKHPMIQKLRRLPMKKEKILFVVEEVTFSSRYRVDHLQEQLLQQGIASDCVSIQKVTRCNLGEYASIVVYRSSKYEIVDKLVRAAHAKGKKVYYDIDDYIFEYSEIQTLKFLEGEDYKDFETYCANIHRSMELCDGYIVSTVNLKKAAEKSFPGKPTVINRNVASMEMLTLSLSSHEKPEEGKIRIGYFSGSKTHNEDFERIREVLLRIMEKNPSVVLYIGGQIELSPEFNRLKDRIETFEFVPWKKLPGLVARADINLMPLEDTFFHACKSENKWMEAALVKVPTIASTNSELAGAIQDGETGYLCSDEKEWEEKLQDLVENAGVRERLAKAAHERVLQRYTTFQIEKEVLDLLFR